jgi:hypothetical protein
MKGKLTTAIIVVIATLLIEGCRKTAVERGNSGNNSGGNSDTTHSRPPVANAGPDLTITILTSNASAGLNGNNSYDSSGMPLQFFWRQISGPASFLQTPGQKECGVYSINTPGVYSYELKVWNNHGADLDTTEITVLIPSYCQPNRSEVPVTLTFLTDLPEQIQDPEIITAGNKLIFPAWFNNSTGVISNNIHIYDLVAQSWTTIHASLARLGAATVSAGNKIFFAGGVNGDDVYTATSVVDIYDLTTNTWSVSNLSEARGYCKAIVSGNKIFFAGGLKNDNILSDKIDIYDLGTNSWSSAVLPGGAREVGAAVTALNKVLFCGGYTVYENPTGFGYVFTTPSASIDIYDNNNGQWSVQPMQVNKGSFESISVNEKVYFAGGLINNAPTYHVEELDVNTMNSSSACLFQSLVSYNDKNAIMKDDQVVFFTPGYSGINMNKFDIYNKQTGIWSIGFIQPNLISTSFFTAIASANNEIYAVINNKLYKMNL